MMHDDCDCSGGQWFLMDSTGVKRPEWFLTRDDAEDFRDELVAEEGDVIYVLVNRTSRIIK